MESLRREVEGCGLSAEVLSNRPALVGRVLLGLRFGASKRLIFGSRSQVGLRMTFDWGPLGLEGGGLLGGWGALALEGPDIGGGSGAS